MAIPAKQIGWSQESNLLWEISKQLDEIITIARCCSTTTTTTTALPIFPQESVIIIIDPCISGGPTEPITLYMEQSCIDLIAPGCHIYADAEGTTNIPEGYYGSWIRDIDYFYVGPDGIVVNVDVCPQP